MWLDLDFEIGVASGGVAQISQQFPPGSPARPATSAQLQAKITDCLAGLDLAPLGGGGDAGAAAWTWPSAADLLRDFC